jgi:very-short-patch-repair endonuclease
MTIVPRIFVCIFSPLKIRGDEGSYELSTQPAFKRRRQELRCNQTDAEKVFWSKMRNRQFHGLKFFRQYSIGPYILDFYCPALKIGVELDGSQHNEDLAIEYDEARSEYLNEQGIIVLRFWNHVVLRDIQAVLFKLEAEIKHIHLVQKHNAPYPPLTLRGGS